jgi:hypothetical protein
MCSVSKRVCVSMQAALQWHQLHRINNLLCQQLIALTVSEWRSMHRFNFEWLLSLFGGFHCKYVSCSHAYSSSYNLPLVNTIKGEQCETAVSPSASASSSSSSGTAALAAGVVVGVVLLLLVLFVLVRRTRYSKTTPQSSAPVDEPTYDELANVDHAANASLYDTLSAAQSTSTSDIELKTLLGKMASVEVFAGTFNVHAFH